MRPNRYTNKNNGGINFHYTYKELREFVAHGLKFGNNGAILVRREGNFEVFKGFGTIESPNKALMTILIEHNPMFDGERKTAEQIVNYTSGESKSSLEESHSIVFLDFGNTEI